MTSLEGFTDTAAVQGLKAVEDFAIATLVQIERAYEAAMAQVADLATNRVRVMAPRILDVPRQGVAVPDPVAEAPVEAVAAPRVSPLVEALQALQVAEATTDAPVEVTSAEVYAEVYAEAAPYARAAPHAEAAPLDEATLITEVVPRPRLVDAEWIAGRHAEAKTDQIPVQAA
jgi:hypothetical protein